MWPEDEELLPGLGTMERGWGTGCWELWLKLDDLAGTGGLAWSC